MMIPKMCLKLSFSYSKWVLQAILFMTILSNCFSSSSNLNIAFLRDCTKFCSILFLNYRIGNLMGIPKMCLKLSFSYYKWVLQAILFMTILSNCFSGSSNFNSTFLPDYTKFFSAF